MSAIVGNYRQLLLNFSRSIARTHGLEGFAFDADAGEFFHDKIHVLVCDVGQRVALVDVNGANNGGRQAGNASDFAHEIGGGDELFASNIEEHRRESGFATRAGSAFEFRFFGTRGTGVGAGIVSKIVTCGEFALRVVWDVGFAGWF